MANHKYDLRRQIKITGAQFAPACKMSVRPPIVDLRSQLPPCFDQGREGSCGPNSADAIMCFLYPQVAHTDGGFSRQQIYYDVRKLEGDVNKDGGVETVDLFNVLETNGAAPENLWPYTPANLLVAPPKTVIEAAAKYRIKSKSQLVTQDDFLNCLAEGFPFVLGIAVFQSLESKQLETTGVYARPNVLVEPLLGGHDVTVVGYDIDFYKNPDFLKSGLDKSQVNEIALLIRNSWGTDWGINGHFWMPIDYAVSPQTGGDAWSARI